MSEDPEIVMLSFGELMDRIVGTAQAKYDHEQALLAALVYCLIHYVPNMALEIDVEAYNRMMETDFDDMQLHRHLYRNPDGTVKMIKVEMVQKDVADEDLHEDDPPMPPFALSEDFARGIN